MKIVTTIAEVRVLTREYHNKRIALVPTMGALHAGHLSLVEIAKKHGDVVVMSIFVNPLQFNSASDLEKYPRTLEVDTRLAEKAGVDILFVPEAKEILPFWGSKHCGAVTVKAGSMSRGLCGSSRPGHFDGVVTVVAALFNVMQPQLAVFGEKDYQQLKVVEQLVRDLHFPVKIIPGPLVREADGIALSSRNVRLNNAERKAALLLSEALVIAQESVTAGVVAVRELEERISSLLNQSPLIKIDYIEIVDVNSLEPLDQITDQAQALIAAFVGEVRLIDNARLAK